MEKGQDDIFKHNLKEKDPKYKSMRLNFIVILLIYYRSALRNVYMLEFHPSLATASRLPEALNHALTVSFNTHIELLLHDMV